MDDLLKQVGYRILSRRKQLRMTQEELAEKAGITPQTVSSAELGKKALRPENIIHFNFQNLKFITNPLSTSGRYHQQLYCSTGMPGYTGSQITPPCF